jgi:hypothetical protein
MLFLRGRGTSLLLLGLLAAIACGELKKVDIPTALPNPAPTVPPAPSPGVTPTPSPSATPTPQPTATPTASATPTPGSSSCRLSSMPECGGREGPAGVFGCCRAEGAQQFAALVDSAIGVVQRERPQLFAGNRVLNEDAFVQAVAQTLEQRFGVCARQGGPSDEVGVKNSNTFSEQYDIVFGDGSVRTGGYTVTCRPARF